MSVFSSRSFDEHEQVLFCRDAATGLRAIIAIHSTALGPALGGCRFWSYGSDVAALEDALRLSRGMTYKNAMAGLSFGGGKSVIMRDPTRGGSATLMQAFGRHIGNLSGRYITAEDVGTSPDDMEEIAKETSHVAGRSDRSGDPSPVTAHGVLAGIRAAAEHRFGNGGLDGVRVAVQGLGSVGMALAGRLHEAGAKLTVTDISEIRVAEAAARFGATDVGPEGIYDADADIFAPCALGAVLNDGTVPRLRAGIVAGAANNQLAEDRHGEALRARGILYAPDYVINAGGVINISCELAGPYDPDTALAKVSAIGPTLTEVFRRAEAEGLPTNAVADMIARERLASARNAAPSDRLRATNG